MPFMLLDPLVHFILVCNAIALASLLSLPYFILGNRLLHISLLMVLVANAWFCLQWLKKHSADEKSKENDGVEESVGREGPSE